MVSTLVLPPLGLLIAFALSLVQRVSTNTFIWDPSSPGNIPDNVKRPYPTFANPPMCVPIPHNLTLCHGIKYSKMRIPNLLHHDSLNEVIQQSESWNQLIKLRCHTDTQLFLCSLFTPVCLDQTIPPCRSLCESVQRGCEPVMLKHGYSWPSMMRCEQFPIDNNMCIQSQTSSSSSSSSSSKIPDQSSIGNVDRDQNFERRPPPRPDHSGGAKDDIKFYRKFLQAICNSQWVIKLGVTSIRGNRIRVKKYKVIYHRLPSSSPSQQSPLTLSSSSSSSSSSSPRALDIAINTTASALNEIGTNRESRPNGKPKPKYVMIGVGDGVRRPLTALHIVRWHPHSAMIKKAVKRAKAAATADGDDEVHSICQATNLRAKSGAVAVAAKTKKSKRLRARRRNRPMSPGVRDS